MAIEEVVLNSADTVFSTLAKVFAALGGILLIYLSFQLINLILNRRKWEKIKILDEKVDKILEMLDKKKKGREKEK